MSENTEKQDEVVEKVVEKKAQPYVKIDPELKARIARMEKEKREAVSKVAVKVEQKKAKPIAGISFKIWWIDVSKRLNLKPHIKEIIWADFKSRGLTEKEPREKYDQALKLFGY